MAADERLNTDQTESLTPIVGSSPYCFPNEGEFGHWTERMVFTWSCGDGRVWVLGGDGAARTHPCLFKTDQETVKRSTVPGSASVTG